MGLLDSEAGKRRLLSVEIPVIERYNESRDPAYKIQVVRQGNMLVLRYKLKPVHNCSPYFKRPATLGLVRRYLERNGQCSAYWRRKAFLGTTLNTAALYE